MVDNNRAAAAAADAALARAVVYRALSVAFTRPTARRLDEIGAHEGFPAVSAALRFLDAECRGVRLQADRVRLKPDLALDKSHALAAAATRLEELGAIDVEACSAEYSRLFGHTTRGLVCACETEYGPDNGFHQPQQLADIVGFYLAFGLRPLITGEVRPDHAACECEFMGFLSRKRAFLIDTLAPGSHASETLEVTDKVERSFLRAHLARFGRAFGARVTAEAPAGIYGAMGHVLVAFIDRECARLGIAGGPLDLAVRIEETDETPMACGSQDGAEPAPLPFYRRVPSGHEGRS